MQHGLEDLPVPLHIPHTVTEVVIRSQTLKTFEHRGTPPFIIAFEERLLGGPLLCAGMLAA